MKDMFLKRVRIENVIHIGNGEMIKTVVDYIVKV